MKNFELEYKSALGNATTMYACAKESNDKKMIQSLELIFPELKKSEDELIGEELIHFLETCQDTRLVGNRRRDEWISWIEKQVEHANFYCKYGGIMPLCSDCKRNHKNSSFKTEEITTWHIPSIGTKQCIDYIQQQSEIDLEKEITSYIDKHYHIKYDETLERGNDPLTTLDFEEIAKYFFELGLKAAKEK